ncbi:hypothetical protein J45TS6_06990 [Paenibacillus sp. J45TS6]|nr:hypothetical protein J45TS6_06990 [Paenibacillus sp. J45TS6]
MRKFLISDVSPYIRAGNEDQGIMRQAKDLLHMPYHGPLPKIRHEQVSFPRTWP